MPLIIVPEDGTGLANANSYGSREEADTYFEVHPYYADAWNSLGEPERDNVLARSAATLDALINWRGYIKNSTQALDWPRIGVIDDEGRIIADNIVPQNVKYAQFELAFAQSRGDPFAASSSEGLESLKIDVIELKFTGSSRVTPVPAAALVLLRGLGDYALGTRVRKVLVG